MQSSSSPDGIASNPLHSMKMLVKCVIEEHPSNSPDGIVLSE